jgi:hypothetical protein
MHGPFLVDGATFARHRWFAYLEPLDFGFGSAVELEERPSTEYGARLMGAESLMACLLRLFKAISTGRLKVRQFLCELHNVRHGLRLAGLGEREAPSAWRVAEDVARLRATWFTSPRAELPDRVKDVAGRALPALLEALWALGERSEAPRRPPAAFGLGAPWSNMSLVPADSPLDSVSGGSRIGFPLNRSARMSELWWRSSRPKIPLHASVLALLTGSSAEHDEFRATRDEIVRSYRGFLDVNGRDYSGIGLAMPYLQP